MKRVISFALCLVLLAGVLAGCGSAVRESGGKIRVVTTIFPVYDWVRQILGDRSDRVELVMLLDRGVDLHSFQPGADDMIKISTCDLFIYVGGESDAWVEDALAEAHNKDMVSVNLLEELGDRAKEEEIREGMEQAEEGSPEEEKEYDEHVWLSLRNAAFLCQVISDTLCRIDPDNKDVYTAETDAYKKALSALDERYKEAVSASQTKTILFGDRFPFRYLTEDYNLAYYAAFAGCSAESEASFETIVFLANKVDELGLKAILQIESADGKIARTIRDATKTKDQAILTLDSLQSTTAEAVANGASYLSAMEKNLETLKEALR